MKKGLYVFLFTLAALLVATLVHAAIELPLLWMVTHDPERWQDVFWWQQWELYHGVGSVVIWLLGLVVGIWGGFRYWRILYVEERYGPPRW